MAANAFYALLERLDDQSKMLLMALLNLFIAYVILVKEGKIKPTNDSHTHGVKATPAKTTKSFASVRYGYELLIISPSPTSFHFAPLVFLNVSLLSLLSFCSRSTPGSMATPVLGPVAHRGSNPLPVEKHIAGSTMQRVGLNEAAPHSWSPANASSFQVRIGPDYNKNKAKAPSGPSLYELVAVDTFALDSKMPHIREAITLPTPTVGAGSTNGVPHLMIINMMAPWYEPSMFGGDLDGKGHSMVFYGQMTESTKRQLENKEPITPAVELLRRFCNDETEKDRLKMIPSLVNAEEVESLPSMVKKMVASYNAKPILMSKPIHIYSKSDTVYEMDVDVHNWAYLATKAYANMHDCLKDLIVEVGYVLQGNDDEELPETILLCARMNLIHPEKATDM